ncbi:MAG: hydrolase [Dongiaceae bacterium]|uniref:hydrolase n=1 Tax=Hyphomicrobium sp. TaxID=82 RepID=UPI003D0E1778
MLIERERSCLLLIDLQERLIPAMHEPAPVLRNAAILGTAAKRLGIPIVISEQYPKGLGRTDLALAAALAPATPIAKTDFSCAADEVLRARLEESGREQAILVGIEAHVCVLQTALGLPRLGLAPFVVADGTTSRTPESRRVALDRMGRDGVEIVTTEMVLFEWLGRAGTAEFKELSALIR